MKLFFPEWRSWDEATWNLIAVVIIILLCCFASGLISGCQHFDLEPTASTSYLKLP